MHHLSDEMQHCVQECLNCHAVCLGEAMNHCLEMGGEHLAPPHFRAMLDCAEMCRTSAAMMLHGSRMHAKTCGLCAEFCAACAESCEKLEGMDHCAQTCRQCEQTCRKMAAMA